MKPSHFKSTHRHLTSFSIKVFSKSKRPTCSALHIHTQLSFLFFSFFIRFQSQWCSCCSLIRPCMQPSECLYPDPVLLFTISLLFFFHGTCHFLTSYVVLLFSHLTLFRLMKYGEARVE